MRYLHSYHNYQKQLEKQELEQQSYDGQPIRVRIDARDIRGGEKNWQHVKKGVPIRVQIGSRDIQSDSVFAARRDVAGKGTGIPRAEFVANISQTLGEIQQGLFDRALQARMDATRDIDTFEEFEAWFTPQDKDKPETHGGFARCHFIDGPEMEARLKPLKVTPRCIPLEDNEEPGTCIFTGQPATKKAIFAKSY